MRRLFILFFSGLTIFSSCKDNKKTPGPIKTESQSATSVNTTKYLISGKSMGEATVGMTKATFLKLFPTAKEDTINLEIELPCLSVLDDDGSLLFQATYEKGVDTIKTLLTSNSKMATAKNIKVGSLYPALLAEYPDLQITTSEGYIAISENGNIMFAVEGDIKMDIIDEATMKTKLKSVSPDTKATTIFID